MELKSSKIIGWIAFGLYLASLFMPYLTINNWFKEKPVWAIEFWLFGLLAIVVIFLTILRNSKVTRHLLLITSVIFCSLCLFSILCFQFATLRDIINLQFFYRIANIEIGYIMCCFSSLLFLVAAILRLKAPARKLSNEIIDDPMI